jgi:hypothetical protein
MKSPIAAVVIFFACLCLTLAGPLDERAHAWPPPGTPVKLPINRDLWMSNVGAESLGNNGGASRLKLKGQQEFSLIDVDTASLKGRIVTGALLHLHCASPKDPALRVSVSTVASPWQEGTGQSYAQVTGASCFAQAELGKRDWAYPGSTFMDVAWGRGHTIWKFADATPQDQDGWQTVAVDPDVVAARVAGLSDGFALYDDVGSIWSLTDGTFTFKNFPNRFFASREQNNAAPYMEVWIAGENKTPPAPVTEITVDAESVPAGEAIVRWKTPVASGGAKTLGFNVRYQNLDVPRYLVPMAGKPGQEVVMWLKDISFQPGESVELSIAAVDAAGNASQPFVKKIQVSSRPRVMGFAASEIKPFAASTNLPQVAGLKIAIVDMLDVINGRTGKLTPAHNEDYKGGNHLYSAEKKLVRLQAARNESVAFQVNLDGKADAVELALKMNDTELQPKIGYFDYVAGGIPDAVMPLKGAIAIPAKDDPEAAENNNGSFLCEIYVPHKIKPGLSTGTLTISAGGQKSELAVALTVWDFTLPDKLSFLPEMNAYGTAMPTGAGLAYYRVAHEHRTVLNRLYYGWKGSVSLAPAFKDGAFEWKDFDEITAGLFDGSAFKDLPRAGEPVDVFYLPVNENWPLGIFDHYTKAYWPEQALSPKYRAGLQQAFAGFASHINQKGWHDTIFEFFLNNKVYFKKANDFKSCSAPWIFDEPVNTQDFWALRYYGMLFHLGADPVRGAAKMWFRCDFSRSHYARNTMWGVLDMEVMGGADTQKVRMKQDERVLSGKNYFSEYGGSAAPGVNNAMGEAWCLAAWCHGSAGVLPWQTIGTKKAWAAGEDTSLFYACADGAVVPSVRLKAFTRGEQDVEYLTWLEDVYDQPHWAVANGVRQAVNLGGKVVKTSSDDAGIMKFDKVDPAGLWDLRTRVAAMVSAKKPAYKRSLRPMEMPVMDAASLPDIGYTPVAPQVEPARPE